MGFLANPRNLVESYGMTLKLFRLTGLFPFRYNTKQNQFQFSWKLLLITIFHFILYIYVNITSLMENWHDYSQPMMGHSFLTAFGNLNLRLLDIIITLLIFLHPLTGNQHHITSLNLYMKILDELVLMDIDVSCIYKRLYYLSHSCMVIWLLIMGFSAWHSIYFFEHVTTRQPELKYYLVVTLSSFYKLLFMCYGNAQLFAIFMISKQINCYLEDLIAGYREEYERNQFRKLQYGAKGI